MSVVPTQVDLDTARRAGEGSVSGVRRLRLGWRCRSSQRGRLSVTDDQQIIDHSTEDIGTVHEWRGVVEFKLMLPCSIYFSSWVSGCVHEVWSQSMVECTTVRHPVTCLF